jgi:hypothetical protein
MPAGLSNHLQERRWPSRQSTCACGGWKSPTSARCLACDKARRKPPLRHCEWCHQAFVMRQRHADPKKGAGRFCTKRCSGLFRAAAGVMPLQKADVRARAAIGTAQYRELHREEWDWRREERKRQKEEEQRHQQQKWDREHACSCGASSTTARWVYDEPYRAGQTPPSGRTRYWCEACFAHEFYARQHVCPNCGEEFYGTERETYCSERCGTQMRKRIERSACYPSIGHLPVDERNKLARLIALMRAAHRRIKLWPHIPTA